MNKLKTKLRSIVRHKEGDEHDREYWQFYKFKFLGIGIVLALLVVIIIVVVLISTNVIKPGGTPPPSPPRPPISYCLNNIDSVCQWSSLLNCNTNPDTQINFMQAKFGVGGSETCTPILGPLTADPTGPTDDVSIIFDDIDKLPTNLEAQECFAAILNDGTDFDKEYGMMKFLQLRESNAASFQVMSNEADPNLTENYVLFCDPSTTTCNTSGVNISFSNERAKVLNKTSIYVCSPLIP